MNTAYIALGSNLQQPKQQLDKAISAIALLGHITAVSSFYQSKAVGPGIQPDYLNAVLCLTTECDALALLDALQTIENQQGRTREIRFGARTLDLDILLFNNETYQLERLIVPHPRMLERNFVMLPLLSISEDLHMPDGSSIKSHAAKLNLQGLEECV
jgi:2-amino-4-hydroxy-6-hydroxymethyldihydropteridine diphosphokinase